MNKIAIYGGLGNQMFQYALYMAFRKGKIRTRISFICYLYAHYHQGFELGEAFCLPYSLRARTLWKIVT